MLRVNAYAAGILLVETRNFVVGNDGNFLHRIFIVGNKQKRRPFRDDAVGRNRQINTFVNHVGIKFFGFSALSMACAI